MNKTPKQYTGRGAEHVDPQVAWKVYRQGKLIDTVFCLRSVGMLQIKKNLIERDGYPPDIRLYFDYSY